jgi:SAM-dependent methyltransferase
MTFRLPRSPLFAAALVQLLGWLLAFAAARLGLVADLWPLIVLQALAAAGIAALLRSPWWWIALHLGFSPALVALHGLGLAPGWYLAAFFVLALVFGNPVRTRVPLFLSHRATIEALAPLLPPDRPFRFLDVGSGTGRVVVALARAFPQGEFTGVEQAILPHLIARWRGRGLPNLHLRRADAFALPWAGYDVLYAFLSPVPMPDLWRKAQAELPPGALICSNEFPIPGIVPEAQLLPEGAGRTLWLYWLGQRRN